VGVWEEKSMGSGIIGCLFRSTEKPTLSLQKTERRGWGTHSR
jgi:hypothetical protein